jgi:hypothetical protein
LYELQLELFRIELIELFLRVELSRYQGRHAASDIFGVRSREKDIEDYAMVSSTKKA